LFDFVFWQNEAKLTCHLKVAAAGEVLFQPLTSNRIEYFAIEPGAREIMPSLVDSSPVKSIGAA
jgi:hypothetical protein